AEGRYHSAVSYHLRDCFQVDQVVQPARLPLLDRISQIAGSALLHGSIQNTCLNNEVEVTPAPHFLDRIVLDDLDAVEFLLRIRSNEGLCGEPPYGGEFTVLLEQFGELSIEGRMGPRYIR